MLRGLSLVYMPLDPFLERIERKQSDVPLDGGPVLEDDERRDAADLVLNGVQAHDDITGDLAPQLADLLDMPYVGYISGVKLGDGKLTALKEYPGGILAEMEVSLPAVLGIQASEEPPRYVAISKVRQMMSTATIEEQPGGELDTESSAPVEKMYLPEAAERAEMLEGNEEEIAEKLSAILQDLGLL